MTISECVRSSPGWGVVKSLGHFDHGPVGLVHTQKIEAQSEKPTWTKALEFTQFACPCGTDPRLLSGEQRTSHFKLLTSVDDRPGADLSRHPVRWPTGAVCDQMNRLKIVPTGDRMRRREFLKSSGVAAIAFPWPALAQKDLPLVAVLVPGTADLARQRVDAVREGRQDGRRAAGVNYAFALRFADGVFDRRPGLPLQLAALKSRAVVAPAAAATA